MKKKVNIFISLLLTMSIMFGCSQKQGESKDIMKNKIAESMTNVKTTSEIKQLEDGLSAVTFKGDYGFDKYINDGGASSDKDVINFLKNTVLSNVDIEFKGSIFGCGTISAVNSNNDKMFGRNFDWNSCDALIVKTKPSNGYSSISTVNMDFIKSGTGLSLNLLPDNIKTIAALYAPLDGMNEKGLCVAVNMIQDSDTIEQNSNKPDITTTTAIRLLLDKAADVDEAVTLLEQYDMHASMGMMIHFAISDANGKSIAIEYIDNKMVVTETPVLTNFYISQGEKYGIGTNQSHERYDILMKALSDNSNMNAEQVKNALDSVSKDNFNEYESTEWSIVFNQTSGEVIYYHRENYDNGYIFNVKDGD
ncbi:MAG: linear amide C-N hydrolase [Clostridiales bacterium]|nr:linear amide C-N hydrolase [Clostridiales bacterium]